jgi:hypothetical protein
MHSVFYGKSGVTLAARQLTREATHAAEMAGGAAAAAPAAATTSAEPLRKRKRGFSTLR